MFNAMQQNLNITTESLINLSIIASQQELNEGLLQSLQYVICTSRIYSIAIFEISLVVNDWLIIIVKFHNYVFCG